LSASSSSKLTKDELALTHESARSVKEVMSVLDRMNVPA
jgi:hypothetical protein